jgi:hypothetical protein
MFVVLNNPMTSIMFESESTTASTSIHFNDYVSEISIFSLKIVVLIITYCLIPQGTDGGIKPVSYSLFLSSVDGIEEFPNNVTLPTSFIQDVTLDVIQPLPRRRLWNYQILALGCSQHPATNLLELSKFSMWLILCYNTSLIFEGTHDIQNIFVSSSSAGEISVTGNFVNGSTATAMLVIVYSDRFSEVYYMSSPPSSQEGRVMTNIGGLPFGSYKASVFVVEENGLPFNRSATTPRSVSVLEGGQGKLLYTREITVVHTLADAAHTTIDSGEVLNMQNICIECSCSPVCGGAY